MTSILSEILDRKREVVARLRSDPAARDFRERALAIRAERDAASIVASTRDANSAAASSRLSQNSNAGRHRLERSAVICPQPTLPLVTSAVAPVPSRS